MDTTELLNDFGNYLENIDLTNEKAKSGTKTIVNVVVSKTSTNTATLA